MKKRASSIAAATEPGNQPAESHSTAKLGSGMTTATVLARQKRRAHYSTKPASEHMSTETNCMVEVFDFETKEVKLMPAAEVGPGMIRARIEGLDKEYGVRLAKIKMRQNPPRHHAFNKDDLDRIRRITDSLTEVMPLSFKAWKKGFRKDRSLGNDISDWLRIADVYRNVANAHDLALEQKVELFDVVTDCAALPREMVWDVVTLDALPREIAAEAVEAFFTPCS